MQSCIFKGLRPILFRDKNGCREAFNEVGIDGRRLFQFTVNVVNACGSKKQGVIFLVKFFDLLCSFLILITVLPYFSLHC